MGWFSQMLQNPAKVQLREVVRRGLPVPVWEAISKRRALRREAIARRQALENCQQEIMRIRYEHGDARHVLVFAPSLNWSSELFQRPQQLAIALARQGVLVFYMQPDLWWNYSVTQVDDRLYLCEAPSAAFGLMKAPLVYILCWNRKHLKGFKAPRLIYDYIDELAVFGGDQKEIAINHKELLLNATLAMATAERLHNDAVKLRPDCVLCPNGVAYDHFASTRAKRAGPPPQPLLPIVAAGKPIIGYYGALANWFDYDLMQAVAGQRRDLSFVLIGPDYDHTFPGTGLSRLANVTWLGPQPYSELPDFLSYFDVAMIPFCLNDITHSTSPLKLFEYMAGGKWVVVTAMHETMRHEGVLVANGAAEFSSKLDEALKLAADPDHLAVIDQVARENTWDARASTILLALDAVSLGASSR